MLKYNPNKTFVLCWVVYKKFMIFNTMRYLKGKMSKYASAVFELNKKNYKNGYCTFICMKLACMYSLATKGSVF